MHSKTSLVLSQYRNASIDSDEVGTRYHFEAQFYNLISMPDAEFVYYEPQGRGDGVYFAYGKIGRIYHDRVDPGKSYAEILNYRKFETPVPRRRDNERLWESEPSYNHRNSVRQITYSTFENICLSGGVELDSLGLEVENPEGDGSIIESFDPARIKVDREPMSVFQILRKISLGEIILNPEFQRNFVWDMTRRSRLIESALLRLPLPALYFDGVDASTWTVVDGLQRLSTLRDFMTKKQFRLEGLEYLRSAAEGKTFDELPRGMQRELEETQLTLFIIRPDTPPEVKFTIFYRINTGGLVLTAQEIRHALFQGKSTDLLEKLSSTDEFRRATDWGVSDTRMEAREVVLRYLAFCLHPYTEYGKSDLNGYLSKTMKEINGMDDHAISSLEERFLESMVRGHRILGRRAFRKFNPYTGRRGPVNKALLESWANALQEYPLENLIERRPLLEQLLGDAFQDDSEYSRSLSAGTGSKASVLKRFQFAHETIQKALR